MKTSRKGYGRCSGCLRHIKVAKAAHECPFCGESLAPEDPDVLGAAAMEKLRGSRSALIAMGLAGGVSLSIACGDPDPKPTPDNSTTTPNNTTNIDPGNDYGGFDPGNIGTNNIDPGNDYGGFDPNAPTNNGTNAADMGTADAAADAGGADDIGPGNITPDYGVFDPDAG